MSLGTKLLERVLEFALPLRCPACGQIVSSRGFCLECWQQLHFIGNGGCESCGIPLDGFVSCCGQCLAQPPVHDGARSALAYGNLPREVVLGLKYRRRIGLAELMAEQMTHLVPEGEDLLLVPVPLHRVRLWQRGFNQAALIIRSLAKRRDVETCVDLLERHKPTPALKGLTRKQREKAIQGAIRINQRKKDLAKGRRILVIDDVYTTGATANACARVLKRAGAKDVRILCWARTLLDDPLGDDIVIPVLE